MIIVPPYHTQAAAGQKPPGASRRVTPENQRAKWLTFLCETSLAPWSEGGAGRRTRMSHHDLIVIVIGSGPAGRRAAVQAAKLKKSVLVVEKGRRVGGVCVHTGTIPSKALGETVLNLSGWRERNFYGRAHRRPSRKCR
jgi:hypothetical protein